MKLLPFLALAALSLAVHAADDSAPRVVQVALAPGKIHEECMRLAAGEKRRFEWKAGQAVDFNIHYHEGPEVFFPVKRDASRGERGTFTAKIAQDYCWMWTARDAAATIEGRIDSEK